MIVLDDSLDAHDVLVPLRQWARGRVLFLRELRPGSVIKDEAVPSLLRRHKHAVFVTTNVGDFWRRVPAYARYCIICVCLPNERQWEIPTFIRRLFQQPEFRTGAARMGRVIRLTDMRIEWYQAARSLGQSAEWE